MDRSITTHGHVRQLPGNRAIWYAVAGSLVTAFVTCPARYLGLVRYLHGAGLWKPVIAVSIEYICIVLVAAACAALASNGPRPQLVDSNLLRTFVPAIAIAIWSAPLMVLLVQRSALTGILAGGMVLACLSSASREAPDNERFRSSDSPVFVKLLALAILSSGALQAAILADWLREQDLALLLFVVGAGLLTLRLPAQEDPTAIMSRRAHWRNTLLSIAIALVVVVLGLLPILTPVGGGGSVDRLARNLLGNWPLVKNRPVKVERSSVSGDGYIGVILTPRAQKRKQVIVPPQLSLADREGTWHPLTIHFTGSYWFFQSPFGEPSYDSIRADGDPITIGVRALNHMPLIMEAVQRLDEPIDASRLSAIDVAITQADLHPTTIAVQLVLTNTRLWRNSEQSLGVQPLIVVNSGDLHTQTLVFAVPLRPRCKQFDRLLLVFWLDRSRDQQAASIAIEDFVLIPKRG